jgi:hypothetical protein
MRPQITNREIKRKYKKEVLHTIIKTENLLCIHGDSRTPRSSDPLMAQRDCTYMPLQN